MSMHTYGVCIYMRKCAGVQGAATNLKKYICIDRGMSDSLSLEQIKSTIDFLFLMPLENYICC